MTATLYRHDGSRLGTVTLEDTRKCPDHVLLRTEIGYPMPFERKADADCKEGEVPSYLEIANVPYLYLDVPTGGVRE